MQVDKEFSRRMLEKCIDVTAEKEIYDIHRHRMALIGDCVPSTKVNFDVRCYFCTTAVQVAISAAVGLAWAGLVIGGEICAAAVTALSVVLAPILEIGAAEIAEFITSVIQNCSGPGELVAEIANWACKC